MLVLAFRNFSPHARRSRTFSLVRLGDHRATRRSSVWVPSYRTHQYPSILREFFGSGATKTRSLSPLAPISHREQDNSALVPISSSASLDVKCTPSAVDSAILPNRRLKLIPRSTTISRTLELHNPWCMLHLFHRTRNRLRRHRTHFRKGSRQANRIEPYFTLSTAVRYTPSNTKSL